MNFNLTEEKVMREIRHMGGRAQRFFDEIEKLNGMLDEAIAARDTVAVRQIKEDIKWYQNEITKSYNAASKFVHGDYGPRH